jgi:hypothetical protein
MVARKVERAGMFGAGNRTTSDEIIAFGGNSPPHKSDGAVPS